MKVLKVVYLSFSTWGTFPTKFDLIGIHNQSIHGLKVSVGLALLNPYLIKNNHHIKKQQMEDFLKDIEYDTQNFISFVLYMLNLSTTIHTISGMTI